MKYSVLCLVILFGCVHQPRPPRAFQDESQILRNSIDENLALQCAPKQLAKMHAAIHFAQTQIDIDSQLAQNQLSAAYKAREEIESRLEECSIQKNQSIFNEKSTVLNNANSTEAFDSTPMNQNNSLKVIDGDQDGDGIVDYLDACPTLFGSKQRQGCP